MKKSDYMNYNDIVIGLNSKESSLFSDGQLQENESKYQLVFQNAPIGLIHFDKEGKITSCNDAFVRIMGSSHEAITGMDIAKLSDNGVVKLLKSTLNGDFGNMEGYISIAGKKPVYGKLNLQPIMSSDGQILGGVGILDDITEHTEYQLRLEYLSQSDPITGLFNRTYFEQFLESINTGLFKDQIAIIVCDIDDLKLINDTMGHAAGDQLLVAAGNILKISSPQDSIVARIGGDEFAILIPVREFDAITNFEKKLEENLALHNAANPEIPVSLSYGYAVSEKNHTDMKVLFREADLLMYQEKIRHRRNSRRSKVQSFLQNRHPFAYLCEEKTTRIKDIITAFCDFLKVSEVTVNYILGLVDYHDIGKVGLEESIALDQFPDPERKELVLEMQKHCEIGYRIALSSDDISILANAILKHHESWNGKGYPFGIKGQEIPLECRIFSIADAYDEILNGKISCDNASQTEVIEALQAMSGKELDPELTGLFIDFLQEKNI